MDLPTNPAVVEWHPRFGAVPMSESRPSARVLLWRARELLLRSPAWLDYVRRVYTIDPDGYPFLSYVGLNFTKDTIKNYKFYFSFFKRLDPAEIEILLPVSDRSRFDALYGAWHPTKRYETIHRGTTFALKIDGDGTLTHYYHLRVAGLPFGPPERLALSPVDEENYHGVCEEFTGSNVHLKRYYYCREPTTIRHSLEIAGLSEVADRSAGIDWLEYIESDGRDKMAWITGDPVLIQTLVEKRGPTGLDPGLARIRHHCGFELFGPGSARDASDHSIYFVLPAGPLSTAGYLFDGVRRFITHHLKLDSF